MLAFNVLTVGNTFESFKRHRIEEVVKRIQPYNFNFT